MEDVCNWGQMVRSTHRSCCVLVIYGIPLDTALIQERYKACKPESVLKKYHEHSMVEGIQNWLKYIPRNQLFILNFERLKANIDIQRDTVNRILQFLGKPNLDDSYPLLMPQSNNRTHNCGGDCNEIGVRSFYLCNRLVNICVGVPRVSCSEIRSLRARFDVIDANLVQFINEHPLRPSSEPEFLPFREGIDCAE